MKCIICNKEFKGMSSHLSKCHTNEERLQYLSFTCKHCGKAFHSENSVEGHYGKCHIYKSKLEAVITERLLKHWFSLKFTSSRLCELVREKYNIAPTPGLIISWSKKYNIKTPTIKETANSTHVREKYNNTCVEKFGCINASQSNDVKKKKVDTFFKHYGRKNIFAGKDGVSIAEKGLMEKYGVSKTAHIPTEHSKKNRGRLSKPHKTLSNLLKGWKIKHKNEKSNLCYGFNVDLNKTFSPIVDILLLDFDIIIEIYGDFWHANPSIYIETDEFPKWEGRKTAKEIWNFDEIRINHIQQFGFDVMVIWESELKNIETLRQKITDFIKNKEEKHD